MFLHTDPHNRPTDVYGGTTSLVSDADRHSYLLLPEQRTAAIKLWDSSRRR